MSIIKRNWTYLLMATMWTPLLIASPVPEIDDNLFWNEPDGEVRRQSVPSDYRIAWPGYPDRGEGATPYIYFPTRYARSSYLRTYYNDWTYDRWVEWQQQVTEDIARDDRRLLDRLNGDEFAYYFYRDKMRRSDSGDIDLMIELHSAELERRRNSEMLNRLAEEIVVDQIHQLNRINIAARAFPESVGWAMRVILGATKTGPYELNFNNRGLEFNDRELSFIFPRSRSSHEEKRELLKQNLIALHDIATETKQTIRADRRAKLISDFRQIHSINRVEIAPNSFAGVDDGRVFYEVQEILNSKKMLALLIDDLILKRVLVLAATKLSLEYIMNTAPSAAVDVARSIMRKFPRNKARMETDLIQLADAIGNIGADGKGMKLSYADTDNERMALLPDLLKKINLCDIVVTK